MRRQFATLFHIAWLLAALLAGTTATARAQANGAPPARVGQIARIEGAVSFARAGGEWEPATPNYPLIGGDTLYAEPGAEAALTFGWSRITLAGGTEFGIAALGEDSATLDVPRGEAFLYLRYLAPGETWRIRTPRGVVTISQDGRYAISAGDAAAPTRIGVIDGAAEVTGDGPGRVRRRAGGDGAPRRRDTGAGDARTARDRPVHRADAGGSRAARPARRAGGGDRHDRGGPARRLWQLG
ncbi:hypothetical protein [Acidiphilium sp. JA12-A1]|uniref:hypothetical protein n=1 Tax=Acidiphilium sp. JA12-A1 TaxID=1464546 RepID=UPI000461B7A2|nr:hypothetical protein ACIDI_67c00220 [Acidiphilium sp. JA12-A1]